MNNEPIISMEGVSFQYDAKSQKISNINLHIQQGECVLLTGPSGSGKTTLTRLMNGLVPHFYEGDLVGSVKVNGHNLAEIPAWKMGKLVGSVFQDSRSQFFTNIVEEEIAFSGENYGFQPEWIQKKTMQLASEYNIEHIMSSQVHLISSGEKQKVSVASARLTDPPIYVLDEPSANLDMNATESLVVTLGNLKKLGKTIVIAEHRLYYVMEIVDRILYMEDGRIVHEWTPNQLLTFPQVLLKRYGLRSPIPHVNEGLLSMQDRVLPQNYSHLKMEDIEIPIKSRESNKLHNIHTSI